MRDKSRSGPAAVRRRLHTFVSTASALITSTFCLRTLLGPVVEEYIRTTS